MPIVKRADGLYRVGESNESAIGADGWFAIVGVLAGIAVALAVYLATRPGRVVPLVALAVGGVAGALVAWRTGAFLGPGDLVSSAASLPVGHRLDAPLKVSAYGVLLTWPMAAVITFFGVSAGADASPALDPGHPAEDPGPQVPAWSPVSPVSPDGPVAPSEPR